MVVCISQPCGELSYDSSLVEEKPDLGESNRRKVIKKILLPNFHTGRPANLNGVVNYDIHPSLAALWQESEEWHLMPSDHCDVYGFKLWSPAWLDESTEMVFDGVGGRKGWVEKQRNLIKNMKGKSSSGIESCASEGWVCCMAFSEYDYLSICLDKRKPDYFGDIHHVNTKHGTECYFCTMDDLLYHLAYFIKEGKERQRAEQSGDYNKASMRPRVGLSKSLKMLRRAVLDTIMRSVLI